MISYLVFTTVLRVWMAVSILLVLVCVGDLLFASGHSFKSFAKRLLLAFVWPLALFSDAGRKSLFKGFRSSQGV